MNMTSYNGVARPYIPNARLDAEDATVELLARIIVLGLLGLLIWGMR